MRKLNGPGIVMFLTLCAVVVHGCGRESEHHNHSGASAISGTSQSAEDGTDWDAFYKAHPDRAEPDNQACFKNKPVPENQRDHCLAAFHAASAQWKPGAATWHSKGGDIGPH